MSLRFTLLPYSPSAAQEIFAIIQHLNGAIFLQSAAKDHPDSRFDILVADPIAQLIHLDGTNTITRLSGEPTQDQADPFERLHQLQSALLPEIQPDENWPFLGGALGYMSYDLGRQVERLPRVSQHDIQLPDLVMGIYDWAVIADHHQQKMVLIEPKSANRLAWLDQQKTNNEHDFSMKTGWLSNMTPESYEQKFEQVKSFLRSGDCYQINLAQRFSAEFEGSEWQAYQKLAQNNGAPFSAFIRLLDAAILSVSPERFLQLREGKIETKPIKGTRPRCHDPVTDQANIYDLKHAEKDNAENLMIVDLLRNDIGRVAKAGTVSVPKLFEVESFPAVHHLVSTVTGKLDDDYHATDLLRACFPGGSITGAPKVRAMEIIENLEPHRRSIYCGSIGYISRCQTMDTNIAIRTLVCTKGKIHAWAGGGLVADSECASEYQETLDKLSRILPLLNQD